MYDPKTKITPRGFNVWGVDLTGTIVLGEGPLALHSIATAPHDNYFRDYDSAIGRYVDSDSIGLLGATFRQLWPNPTYVTDEQMCSTGNSPPYVKGVGFGSNPAEAFANAKLAANAVVPQGCYKRHCHGVEGSCKNWK